jgi:hypothetical protein
VTFILQVVLFKSRYYPTQPFYKNIPMKKYILLLLISLGSLNQNASAQAVNANDKKPAVIADNEIKRGPLADFYDLVAQHPASAISTANTASNIKTPPQDNKTALARQNTPAATPKPVAD